MTLRNRPKLPLINAWKLSHTSLLQSSTPRFTLEARTSKSPDDDSHLNYTLSLSGCTLCGTLLTDAHSFWLQANPFVLKLGP